MNGAREYWIADPEARTVEVFSPRSGHCEPRGFFGPGESVESPLLPGLSLPVLEIFA